MYDIRFDCPHCGRRITAEEGAYGTTVACPACRGGVIIPPLPDPSRPPAKVARLILDEPQEAVAPAPDDREYDVFDLRPAARAFAGRILLGALLTPSIIGLVLLAYDIFHLQPATNALAGRLLLAALLLPLIVSLGLLAGVWWRVRSSRYRLTTQRLFVQRGLVAKRQDEIELYRVKDVRVDQGLLQRLLGVGRITVLSSDDTTPAVTLEGVRHPQEIKETIRTHYRTARKREGVRSNELIPS